MSNAAVIDARQKDINTLIVYADFPTSGIVYFKPPETLDTGYTITIGGQTYTVGSGLTLDGPSNTIAWALDSSVFTQGTKLIGQIESDSNVWGTYMSAIIQLFVQ